MRRRPASRPSPPAPRGPVPARPHHAPGAVRSRGSGNTLDFQVSVATASGGTITLSASVSSSNADTDSSDNTVFETTTVTSTGRNLIVSNTNDSGAGSLRQAMAESNADSGDRDTIVF